MRTYTIRITDTYGVPRVVTVTASSAIEALRGLEPAEGELVEQIMEGG